MARILYSKLDEFTVDCPIVAARPTAADDGVSVASWLLGGAYSTRLAVVEVDGSAAMTIGSPTGGTKGAEVWVQNRNLKWRRVGYLNDGDDVDIASATQGYASELNLVGLYSRVAIVGTPAGGTAIAHLIPVEQFRS